MATSAAEVPPAGDTLERVVLAVAGRVWEPAIELLQGQAVVVLPLSEVELWPELLVGEVCS